MPIDPTVALSAPASIREVSWTQRDVLLYHLSLGAGREAVTDPELDYTFERELKVLPTFAMVAGGGISAGDGPSAPGLSRPGIDIDLHRILHGGQSLTVHRPLPSAGRATVRTRVADVWDKTKAAVIVLEHEAVDEQDQLLWTTQMQIFARGEGGFGGHPGPESGSTIPQRQPDRVLISPTAPNQAMLYRLNGDLNPLHVDPEFARRAGFAQPILHGLASYGLLAKALVDQVLDGDAARLESLSVRFAGVLIPGESLQTSLWQDGDNLTLVATCPERDNAVVLSQGTARIRPA